MFKGAAARIILRHGANAAVQGGLCRGPRCGFYRDVRGANRMFADVDAGASPAGVFVLHKFLAFQQVADCPRAREPKDHLRRVGASFLDGDAAYIPQISRTTKAVFRTWNFPPGPWWPMALQSPISWRPIACICWQDRGRISGGVVDRYVGSASPGDGPRP